VGAEANPLRSHVKTPPPPAVRPIKPHHWRVAAGSHLVRIYDPRPGSAPDSFRYNGPRARFDHHRAPTPDAPADDSQRGIWYGVPATTHDSIRACVLEVFGDTPGIDLSRHLAHVDVRAELRLLDLRGAAAWDAGVAPQVTATDFPSLSQAWSRYFYDNVAVYDEIDGLIYHGAICGTDSVALYERAAPKLGCTSPADYPLNQQPLFDEILRISRDTGLPLL
jgi:hypothetical protein